MKWQIGFCLLLSLSTFAENKIKYPVVRVATGRVLSVDKSGTEKALKKTEILKEKDLVRTTSKSILQIDLDDHTSLSVLENSEVSIPGISWEDGSTERIDLNHGDIQSILRRDHPRCHRDLFRRGYHCTDFSWI
jgi:hypothetical protein